MPLDLENYPSWNCICVVAFNLFDKKLSMSTVFMSEKLENMRKNNEEKLTKPKKSIIFGEHDKKFAI